MPLFPTVDTNGAISTPKTVTWLNNAYRNGVSAKSFGATGDGTTNDTTAIQAWLTDTSKHKYLPSGTYLINSALTCSISDSVIYGPGVLKANTAEIIMLTLSGHRVKVDGLGIDGNNLGRYGLRFTGMEPIAQNCTIQNLKSTTSTARGIDTNTTTKMIIRDNIIRNIDAPGNASQGDNNGMTRAIVAYASNNATEPSIISGNWIDNITGEEGDGIAVLASDGVTDTDDYQEGWVRVSDNIVRNCGRRHIKVQASDAWIDGNWCYNTSGFTVTNPSNVIDVIQGNRVRITNNVVKEIAMGAPISVSGASTNDRIIDIDITGNNLTEGDNTNPVIYISHADNVSIKDNILTGGTYYVLGGTADGTVVTGNICRGGVQANTAFSFTSSASGFIIKNVIVSGRTLGTATNFTYDSTGSGGATATKNSLFAVRYINSAWEYTTLSAAQTAGLNTEQTVMFIGNPGGTLPGWERPGDIWTQG